MLCQLFVLYIVASADSRTDHTVEMPRAVGPRSAQRTVGLEWPFPCPSASGLLVACTSGTATASREHVVTPSTAACALRSTLSWTAFWVLNLNFLILISSN
jgi:hypothetical protein